MFVASFTMAMDLNMAAYLKLSDGFKSYHAAGEMGLNARHLLYLFCILSQPSPC